MTEEEKKEYIKNNCKQCPYCTGFNQCVQFDYDDLEIAVEKCMTGSKE